MKSKKTKLYTFGCSFTKDNYQSTWANFCADDYNLELFNLAERGAGSDFAIKRLLTTDINPEDSVVMIMWPSADRYDLWADNTTPHLVADRQYASWPDGIAPQLVDFYGNYTVTQGFNLNGSIPRGYKNYFYKYLFSVQQAVHNWYTDIITAQLFLDSQNIEYIMTSSFPLTNPIHYHHDEFNIIPEIYNRIDLTKFTDGVEHQGFLQYCQSKNLPFFDSHHPAAVSHRHYVDNMLKSRLENILEEKRRRS